MSTASSAGYTSWFPAWYGFASGLCLVLPNLLRLQRESWTEADIFFLVAGIILVISCVARLVIILPQAIRQEVKAESEGPERLGDIN